MTSGEWDLRALKALEEEELALFQSITEPEQIQRSSVTQLPPIAEVRSLGDSVPSSPCIPLPPILVSKLSSSCGPPAAGCATSTPYCSSSSSRDSGSGSHGSRKYRKTQQRHSLSCKAAGGSGERLLRDRDRDPDWDRDWEKDRELLRDNLGPTTIESNDMMAMMMFLSSTTPSEVSIPAAGGTTTSLVGTATTSSSDGCDDITTTTSTTTTCRGKTTKKSGCNATKRKSSTDAIDYELEDHIKHCSCSCNHMGYGNSMDYQTTGFGGLPDVTEHSNIRRAGSIRQDSISNSESAEVASLQKSKKPAVKTRTSKRNYCIVSLSIVMTLLLCAILTAVLYQFYLTIPSRNSHDERLRIVERILREVPLVDGHNDLAWNVRKYAHSSLEMLDLGQELDQKTVWHRPPWSQTDIPRLKKGLVGAQIWSAYVPCEAQGLDAVQLALEQIDIIHRLAELHPKDLALVVSSQEILVTHRRGMLASLIGIEGGHALGSSLGVLRSMHSLGARYLTLTHQCDISWAGSSTMSMEKGLSQFGKAVVKEMNRLGMMIDLSHSSDATARDVLDVTRAPVIFSHSAARTLCNSSRNVPDDILRAVADNGGLIMVSFASHHITCEDTSALQDVVAHLNYIRSIAGIQHIGIGAGYDGIESPPIGLEDVSKYPNLLAKLLEDPNWSEEDIAMLAGKNFLRVLKSVENVRDYWKRAAIPPLEVVEPIKKTQCTYMTS